MTDAPAIPAASVLILRDPLEVLMILRSDRSSFVPGTWVFPGGVVDSEDGPPDSPETLRNAARREALEETGLQTGDDLVLTSRWITPFGMPKRFDTWFFLAACPTNATITLQEDEAVDHMWISPIAALSRHKAGDFPMVFPTIRNLEALLPFRDVTTLLEARRTAVIEPVRPVMVMEGGKKKIRLP